MLFIFLFFNKLKLKKKFFFEKKINVCGYISLLEEYFIDDREKKENDNISWNINITIVNFYA